MMSHDANGILFLGPADSPVLKWLQRGEKVKHTCEPIGPEWFQEFNLQHLVSHGYRHILRTATLNSVPGAAVNLHISLLPWNRGADPNLWSFVEKSPKGVTIHYIDAGVDTGDIIAQRELFFDPHQETLASSYHQLQSAILELFKRHWPQIKAGTCPREPQPCGGSSHRLRDKSSLAHILEPLGWDTPVHVLEGATG